jgi:CheY-like chemotaxis protein
VAKANAKKILIVDDEAATRWLVRLVLGGSYEIIEAGSVPEAFECVRKNDFDLVLLDVMMPGMS